MELFKKFLESKEAKRAFWTMLNVLMAFLLALLVFLSGSGVAWAVAAVPPFTALSQFLTKYLNS